jgi:hypothetical protein
MPPLGVIDRRGLQLSAPWFSWRIPGAPPSWQKKTNWTWDYISILPKDLRVVGIPKRLQTTKAA